MTCSWNSRLATTRSMRSMAFGTAQSMPRSQQANYQSFIIWSRGKATLRRKILGSLHWQSSTFKSSSPPTTKTIQKSRQQHLPPSIWLCRWLSYPLHPGQQPSPQRLQQRNKTDFLGPGRPQQRNVVDLLGPPPSQPSEQKCPRPLSYSISSGFPP